MESVIFWGLVIALVIWLFYRDHKKRNTIYIDKRGYQRNGYHRLIHRNVAYHHLYSKWKYRYRFGSYDVHHKDRNKLNNDPDNLEILTRAEHRAKHRH